MTTIENVDRSEALDYLYRIAAEFDVEVDKEKIVARNRPGGPEYISVEYKQEQLELHIVGPLQERIRQILP